MESPLLFKLPVEIIFNIAHHLPIKTLFALSITSKSARKILHNEVKRELDSRSALVWGENEVRNSESSNVPGLAEHPLYRASVSNFKRLVTACQEGDASIAQRLLCNGVSPNPPSSEWEWLTPLQAASRGNHRETIRILLDAGAKITSELSDSAEAAVDIVRLLCSGNQDAETVALLLGCPGMIEADYLEESLKADISHISCSRNLPVSAISILMSCGLWSDDASLFDGQGYTPTGAAIAQTGSPSSTPSQQLEKVRFLLQDQLRRDQPCLPRLGQYPIDVAAARGSPAVMRMLLHEFSADPNLHSTDEDHDTPLCAVIQRQEYEHGHEMVEMLLDAGALCNIDAVQYSIRHGGRSLRLLFDTCISHYGLQSADILLVAAAQLGDVTIIQQILSSWETEGIKSQQRIVARALFRAARFNHSNAFEALLPHIEDSKVDDDKWDDLLGAVRGCTDSMLHTLLGRFSLHPDPTHARQPGCLTVMTRLVQHIVLYRPLDILSLALSRVQGPILQEEVEHILDNLAKQGATDAVAVFLEYVELPSAVTQTQANAAPAGLFGGLNGFVGGFIGFGGGLREKINPLCTAVKYGHLAASQALAKWRPRYLHERGADNELPVVIATTANHPDILTMLLSAGASPTPPPYSIGGFAPKEDGPCVLAAERGYIDILRVLLAHGCDVDTRHRESEMTLLSFAALNGHTATARFLLDHGANINAVDKMKRTALSYAALRGASTTRLLLESGAAVDGLDVDDRTPFFLTMIEDRHVMNSRIYYRAELAAKSGCHIAISPRAASLSTAAVQARLDICRLLLEYGASPLDGNGIPGYPLALENDLGEILQLYIELGMVPVDVVDGEKRTLLLRAVEKGYLSVARVLVDAGCDVSRADFKGRTPLQLAESDEMVKILYSRR